VTMDRGPIEEDAEQRRIRLYTPGLSKTLATPHRKHVRRLAIQRALRDYRELIPPEDP
jgi:predicted PP-loop superfamily ATPase